MDWTRAIERNREALWAIIASLGLMMEMAGSPARITRPFHRAVLRILHPAESAVRRLIVMVARGLVAKPAQARPGPFPAIGRGTCRRLTFRLFDPRKRFTSRTRPFGPRLVPRIHVFGPDPRVSVRWASPSPAAPPSTPDDGLIDGRRLVLRFEAMKRALGDLPGQAKRLARLLARRQTRPGLYPRSPLRPGPPPGGRKAKVLDVDFVLAECHGLAHDALRHDTS